MSNYAFTFKEPLPTPSNGHVFEDCNFTQKDPHTAIFAGVTGLTFRNCNLTNCDVPEDATIESCLHVHVTFCSHIHDNWLQLGLIDECVENCSHVVDTDEITIDGQFLGTTYHYEDTIE